MHGLLAIMTPDGYRLGFGDNDFEGWLITVAYFVSAGLCAWAWRGEEALGGRDGIKARPLVWAALAMLLVPLGLNKQLDFQHWLIFAVRDRFSTDPELWSHRYVIGAAVGACAAGVVIACGAVALRYVGTALGRYSLAFVGLVYLTVIIFARAGSFLPVLSRVNGHHLEALHLMLELGALLMIGGGAARAIAHLNVRQRAVKQDAMVFTGGLRLVGDASAVTSGVELQPAARQAA